jgi:CheY-like chemotaxis protein
MTATHLQKVLIVDDERLFIYPLKDVIESAGFEVESAMSGKEALEKIRKSPPDIVVLDLMMPEMNGFEVAREIKGDERFTHIPIVMLTGFISEEAAESHMADIDEILTKPITSGKLLTTIRKHLSNPPQENPQ